MNYINTTTGEYPVSEAQIRLAYPNTSFPVPFQAPKEYAVVFQAPQPTFDVLTQSVREVTPVLTNKGHYEQAWEVIALDAETVSLNQEAKEVADTKLIAERVETLWQAANRYVTGYISGVAIGILTIGVIQGKPKALAVTAWSNAIWSDYYARKELITSNEQPNLDFSSHGSMPHTVPELQVESGM